MRKGVRTLYMVGGGGVRTLYIVSNKSQRLANSGMQSDHTDVKAMIGPSQIIAADRQAVLYHSHD